MLDTYPVRGPGSAMKRHRDSLLSGLSLFMMMAVMTMAAWLYPAVAQAPVVDRALKPSIEETFVVGRVLSVGEPKVDERLLGGTGMVSRCQLVEVEILEGPWQGRRARIRNEITDNPAYNILVKPGQEVILSIITENGGAAEINISDYRRAPVIAWLFAVFLIVFLLFGGKQGVKSLIGLGICVLLVALVLLPLSLRGINPLLTAVAISMVAATASMVLVAGLSRKAAAAVLGTIGGVIIAGVAAQLTIHCAPLTGLSSEEAQILRASLSSHPPQFFNGLLAAGMLIGALGVIMDVSISIASAVFEVRQTSERISAGRLFRSGMNVGRDIMGTMTNTLVLAYAGGALPLLLLAYQMPSTKLLNLDLVATEVAAALAGSLGLVCTIPLTALISARLMAAAPQDVPADPFASFAVGTAPESGREMPGVSAEDRSTAVRVRKTASVKVDPVGPESQ